MKLETWTRFTWAALLGAALFTLAATATFAQGELTGTIAGTVTTSAGEPLPGVTVSATSEALLGPRTAFSGDFCVERPTMISAAIIGRPTSRTQPR